MSRKNYGMKMTEEDIKAKITENKQRLVRQQERAKKLKESMERNRTDIKQLEYTLQKIKRSRLKTNLSISSNVKMFPPSSPVFPTFMIT